MSLSSDIMNLPANKTLEEIKKSCHDLSCSAYMGAYLLGHKDARHVAAGIVEQQEKSITAKEIEKMLEASFSIEKRTRETVGRPQKNYQEILDLVLGMIQEKLQVEFCPGCGRILPCNNCNAKAERG